MPVPVLWLEFARRWARRVARRKGENMKKQVVSNILVRFLTINAFADYRRTIGIALVLLAGIVTLLTSEDLVGLCAGATSAVCGKVLWAQPKLLALGTYIASVGELLKKTRFVPKS